MADADNQRFDASALSAAHEAGDAVLLEQLLDQHRPYLLRVVKARMSPGLRPRVDASDIVQEAQLEASRRVEAFLQSPDVPIQVWLRQLAVDRLIMAERKHVHAALRAVHREHKSQRTDSDVVGRLAGGSATPSRAASDRETATKLRGALDQLRHADREIILMHLYEGLTSQESAAALGIEPAAARKRLGRAVQRLQKVLEAQGLGASSL